jgi:hypothetical protein
MMSAAPRNAQGEASGLLATGRVIGQSMSVALTGTIFAALGGAAAGTLLSWPQAQNLSLASVNALQQTFVSSFHAALLVCAAFAALGIFTALARGNEAAAKKYSLLCDNIVNQQGNRKGLPLLYTKCLPRHVYSRGQACPRPGDACLLTIALLTALTLLSRPLLLPGQAKAHQMLVQAA